MNNAPPPSSSQSRSQALPPAPSNNNHHGAIPSSEEDEDNETVSANNNGDGVGDVSDTSTTPEQRAQRLRILKTIAFLDHLIRSFDLVVYCQISILYYMEYVHGISSDLSPSPHYTYNIYGRDTRICIRYIT